MIYRYSIRWYHQFIIEGGGVCEKKMTMSLYNLLRSNDIQNRAADNQ